MASSDTLLSEETVYVSHERTQREVFTSVATDLAERGLVKPEFLHNLIEREASYPTGMDMSLISPELPNIAIPHTEVEFVNTTRIVPIKLARPIAWHSMIDPAATFDVSFLFMILNASKEAQVGLLARIMDFVNGLGVERARELFGMDDPHAIYAFMAENFPTE